MSNKLKEEYLGTIITKQDGDIMTVIRYNGYRDVDVMFDDGTIVRHLNFTNVKRGHVKNPMKKVFLVSE